MSYDFVSLVFLNDITIIVTMMNWWCPEEMAASTIKRNNVVSTSAGLTGLHQQSRANHLTPTPGEELSRKCFLFTSPGKLNTWTCHSVTHKCSVLHSYMEFNWDSWPFWTLIKAIMRQDWPNQQKDKDKYGVIRGVEKTSLSSTGCSFSCYSWFSVPKWKWFTFN